MKAWAIAVKEFKEIFRDTGGLMLLFVVPFALIVVFNLTMAGAYRGAEERPFRVPVANLDKGDLGAELVKQLDSSKWIAVESTSGEGKEPLTEASAIARVENGSRNVAVVIPADFSEKIKAGKEVELRVVTDPALPSQFAGPVIGALQGALMGVVMPEQMKAEMPGRIEESMARFEKELGIPIPPFVREKLTKEMIYEQFVKGTEGAGGFSLDGSNLLAKIKQEAPPSVKREKYPTVYQQTASGNTVMFVFFVIMLIGSSFLEEKKQGTFRRLLAAPVGRSTILFGKLFPALCVNFLQVGVMFGASILLFGVDLGNSPLGMVVITLCLSLSVCGLGLLVAALFRTQTQLSGMSVLIILISSALSGAMVPRFIMGEAMQQIGLAVPQTWALEAYQQIMVRGGGLMEVLPHCGVLLAFTAAFFALAVWRFRFE
jgi:ABC-2 type transport system permease protein